MTGGSPKLRLFSGPLSMFGAKAEIAAREKGLDFELVMVPFDMQRLYEPKHPEVARINPKRQVPVLIHGDVAIFDSTQIFEYLEDLKPAPALWPAGTVARAQARLLELKSDEVYFPPIVKLMGRRRKTPLPSPPATRPPAITRRWNRSWRTASISPAPTRSRISRFIWRSSLAPAWGRPCPQPLRAWVSGGSG